MTLLPQELSNSPPAALPRARGRMILTAKARDGRGVIDRFRTSGCLKALYPAPGRALEAIMINTSGGLTGGDRLSVQVAAGPGSALSLTTQAAERAYRAASGTARVETRAKVAEGARLLWLPQELILFDGAALDRRLQIDLAPDARLLMVEPLVFGRRAMGERLTSLTLRDRIEIRRARQPLYMDRLYLTGDAETRLSRPALAQAGRAMASALLVDPRAEALLDRVRAHLPETGGASLLAADVLTLRIVAEDVFALRRALVPILEILKGGALPRSWSL